MNLTFEQFIVLVAAVFSLVWIVANTILEWRRIGKQPTWSDVLSVLPSLDNAYTRTGAETLYNSLPEREKRYIDQLLQLASPLTEITSFDEDNEAIQWLKERTTSPANPPAEPLYNPSEADRGGQ